jgi:large repetitive protein
MALPAFAGAGPYLDVPVTPPAIVRAAGTQKQPRIATDGRDFFAVWIDSRGEYGSLYGTRVLAHGTVLDPSGILLSASQQFCDSFALAWDGSNYVVVWQADSRVNAIRVDRDGTVLGQARTVFDQTSSAPSIASNGTLGASVGFTAAFPGIRPAAPTARDVPHLR